MELRKKIPRDSERIHRYVCYLDNFIKFKEIEVYL